jgi:uncharacterized membrane protein
MLTNNPSGANNISQRTSKNFGTILKVILHVSFCILRTESFPARCLRTLSLDPPSSPPLRGPFKACPFRGVLSDASAFRPIDDRPQTTSKGSLRAIRFPLIAGDDSWGNIAALTGSATVAQILGRTTAVGKLLGAPVTAMALTFAMASVGVLNPGGTVASKSLQLLTLQLATPLILMGADLRDCVSRCGPLLLSFAVASVATIVACVVGWKVSGSLLTTALGRDGLVIAAALMAKNVGGGINYIAVCRSLSASPQAIAAGLCVDNLFALIYFPVTTSLGTGRPDVFALEKMDESSDEDLGNSDVIHCHKRNTLTQSLPSMTVQSFSTAICVSSILLWLGERIGGSSGGLPLCTLLAVLFASQAPSKFMQSIQESSNTIGTTCLYLFFSTAGAPGMKVADSVKSSLLPLTLFLTCLYSIHGLILWLANRLFCSEGKEGNRSWRGAFLPQRLLVASSSAIGGPATSVALAKSNGWKSLEVPSLLVGNIGYAIATFCGLAYYGLFRR